MERTTVNDRLRKLDEKRELKEAKKREKLHRREADELIESILENAMTIPKEELLSHLPKVGGKMRFSLVVA